MSRRDTIIVAVLINAGLLTVLFVSSLKSEPSKMAAKQEEKVMKKDLPIARVEKERPVKEKAKPEKAQKQKTIFEPKVQEIAKKPSQPLPQEPKKQEAIAQKQEVQKPSQPMVAKVETKVEPEFEKVIVKKGDFLEKIAKNHGTTVGAIMERNKLTDSRLQIGQVLYIPKSSAKSIEKKQETPVGEFYIVKDGDNLWKIAIENGVSVEALLRLNKLTQKKAKMLRPGDKLILR